MNTTELTNFKIYEDGELVRTDYAKKQVIALGTSAIDGLEAYGGQVRGAFGNLVHNIGLSLSATIHDAIYKTDYAERLHGQWATERETAFVERLGL